MTINLSIYWYFNIKKHIKLALILSIYYININIGKKNGIMSFCNGNCFNYCVIEPIKNIHGEIIVKKSKKNVICGRISPKNKIKHT